jgi:extracellular elastinolytic metalloproteinase
VTRQIRRPTPSSLDRKIRLSGEWTQPTLRRPHLTNNQCTGNPHYQGEQDNDPQNVTDCRLGSPVGAFPPRNNEVRAAEVQVFSSTPTISGAKLADGRHDHDDDDD